MLWVGLESQIDSRSWEIMGDRARLGVFEGYARGDSWTWARLWRVGVAGAGGKGCFLTFNTPWARV